MADQADDLSIPMKPVRPMAGVTPPPRVPDLPRPGAEPARAPASPHQRTAQAVGSRDNEVDARTLIVGREIFIFGRRYLLPPAHRRR